MEQEVTSTVKVVAGDVSGFMSRVYAWMTTGLFLTGIVGYCVANNEAIFNAFIGNSLIFFFLLLAEIGLVVYLSSRVAKMSITQANIVFFLYSALNGVTLSVFFIIYTASSIASVFLVTGGMFGLFSMYGFMTKKDLTTMGQYAFMGLLGLIVASIVNLFMMNDGFMMFLSCAAVIIFVILTAYDTQKLKALVAEVPAGSEAEKRVSILGALTLYLDFINLFLNLLRIMGKRR